MSTIEELVNSGAISRIKAEMDKRDQPMRLLYGTPGFIEWLNKFCKAHNRRTDLEMRRRQNKSTRSSMNS
jgi:hypothetical protein